MKLNNTYYQPALIIASFAFFAAPHRAEAMGEVISNRHSMQKLQMFINDEDKQSSKGSTTPLVSVLNQANQQGQISYVPQNNVGKNAPVSNAKTNNFTPAIVSSSNPPPQGEDRVILIADEVQLSDDQSQIIANGNVEATNQGRRLNSDKLVYDRNTGIVTASGKVIIIEADGSTSFADSVVVDDKLASGVVSNFAARFGDGSLLAANTAVKQNEGRNSLSKLRYTACPVCEKDPKPTWSIRARKAVQDTQNKEIYYQDVFFEVEGVPVMYMPYFKHGDPSAGRQSGFLQPRIGKSSRLGLNYRQPYMYVIDDYSDITVAPQLNSYVNPILFTEYRRKFYSGGIKLSGSVTKESLFTRDKEMFGETSWRGHIFADGIFKINDTWKWGFGVENASDAYYLNRYSIIGQGDVRGPVRITGTKLVKQLYTEGKSEGFYARVIAAGFQDLTSSSIRRATPKVLPSAELHKSWKIGPWGGVATSNSNLAYITRNHDGTDSGRISSAMDWQGQKIIGNGFLAKPFAQVKGDYFTYKNFLTTDGTNIGSKNLSRFNAMAGVDFSLPMHRVSQNYTFLLEPRLKLKTATNNAKLDDIIIEDGLNYRNDYTSYFQTNSVSINDYYDSGSSATFGLNLAAVDRKNNSLEVFVGKQIRSKDNKYNNVFSNLDSKNGDWVGNANLKIGSLLTVTSRGRFDGDNGDLVEAEIGSKLNYKNLALSLRYNEISKDYTNQFANKELISGFEYKLGKYTLFADNWHDFYNDVTLKQRYGVKFGDECTDIRIFYEESNTLNQFIRPSQGVKLQIAFRTLGVIDDDPFE